VSGQRPLLYGPGGTEVLAWAGQGREAALQQIAVEALGHLLGLPPGPFELTDPRHIAQAIGRLLGPQVIKERYPQLQVEMRSAKQGEEVPEP
jgi:hypothetical protein